MSGRDLGLDGRIVAALVGITVIASAAGYLVAAGLDGQGARAAEVVPAPPPVVSPEAQDPSPPTWPLPAVAVPTPLEAPPAPGSEGTATTGEPAPTAPAASTATTTVPPTPPTAALPPTASPARPRPTEDVGVRTPFRPAPPTQPLAQHLIPDGELPPDLVAASEALHAAEARAPSTGATRADIRYALRLGAALGDARLAGRQAAVGRSVRVNAWWYSRREAPAAQALVRDPQGLIYSYRRGHGFQLNPVGTAGRWQRLNEGFTSAQLAEALLEVGVAEARGGRQTTTWEYYDVPDEPAAVRPNVSGMAQSRVAELMATAYKETGDARFATAAADGIASLTVGVDAGGARSLVAYPTGTEPSPWYVERAYPGANPWKGAALNGFMVAILELRSAERALRAAPPSPVAQAAADEALRLADDGARTLDRYLPLHDSGHWSYYGMLAAGRPWRTYLANTTYHCYHVALLRSLAGDYPSLRFAATADRWAGYATRAGVACPSGSPTG